MNRHQLALVLAMKRAHGDDDSTPAFALTAPENLQWLSGPEDSTPLFGATYPGLQVDDVGILRIATDAGFVSFTDYTNTADLGEAGALVLQFTTGALNDGQYWAKTMLTRGALISDWSNTVTETIDAAPAITSANSANNVEGVVLAHALTANQSVTWSIVGGADQALFEISGSTLRWASNGVQDYETPADADLNNTYVVVVRATDASLLTTDQTITITVTDVLDTVTRQTVLFSPIYGGIYLNETGIRQTSVGGLYLNEGAT